MMKMMMTISSCHPDITLSTMNMTRMIYKMKKSIKMRTMMTTNSSCHPDDDDDDLKDDDENDDDQLSPS